MSPQHRCRGRLLLRLGVLLAVCAGGGCAAVTNPTVDGVPVRRLPPEAFGESRENFQRVPAKALRQNRPKVYLLGPGDVLGVFIEGVLGERTQPPPVRIPELGDVPPALGYPLPVREDGTVPLPLIDPVKVEGLSVAEAQAKIVEAYTTRGDILKKERTRIIVTLMQRRKYHVLVLREDTGGSTFGTQGGFGPALSGGGGTFFSETRRAAGFALELPAYENDVLNALTRTGGLPGPEAEDEVIVERGAYTAATGQQPGAEGCLTRPAEEMISQAEGQGTEALRIPLRLRPGQPLELRPKDIILDSGDVVIVRARRNEFFYTGGLLPTRAFPVPRDRDLDVLQAVALIGGPIINGGVNVNNLSGSLVQTGIGFASPSQLAVVRKTKDCGQITILVNLNRALRDPRERILVQEGDFLILQQSVDEGFSQWLTTNFRYNYLGFLVNRRDFVFTTTGTLP